MALICIFIGYYTNNNAFWYHRHRISDGIAEERQLKVMEMELMAKRMEHEERMQRMKLEQLRLEIELEKIRVSKD